MIRVLGKYREDILDMQLIHGRIAWSVVDLYAMAAVLSKLQSSLDAAAGKGQTNGHTPAELRRELIIGKGFCRRAASKVSRRLSGLFRNDDTGVLAVADAVLGMEPAADGNGH